MTIAETFAKHWHTLPASEFPARVLQQTSLRVEDTLAVSFAAASLGLGTAASRVVTRSGPGPATLWCMGQGVSAGEAALANGMLAHAMDYDDLHAASIMHASAVVVPTAVALAERQQVSGTELLASAAVGYQVAALLGRLAPGHFQEHGFQSTAVLGTFAAAAVSSRLLGLSSKQAVHAYGIAGSMASGLMEFLANGSDVKQMHAGWSAQSGIRAAELAAEGFTGPATVFEGRFGVFRSFARVETSLAACEALDLDHWEVEDISPKPYPACLCVHPQVQAILELRQRGDVSPARLDDIVEIRCDVPRFYVGLVYEPATRKRMVGTPYEARFSAAYCIARALLDGKLEPASFSPDKINDATARAIAAKVTYREESLPEFPRAFPARVTVHRRDGTQASSYVAHNFGSPGNPFDTAHVDEKFATCMLPAIGQTKAAALLRAVQGLPSRFGASVFFGALRDAAAALARRDETPKH